MSISDPTTIGSLPPEILEVILQLAAPHPSQPAAARASRNTNLLAFSLVNSAFNVVATRLLYCNLLLDLRATTATQLARTLDRKPELAQGVRSLAVNYTSASSWTTAWLLARKDTWTVEDEQWEWHNRPTPGADGEDVYFRDDQWASWSYFESKKAQWATSAMAASGDGLWLSGQEGRGKGAAALFHLVGRLTHLQHLKITGFTADGIAAVTLAFRTQAVLRNLSAFACVASDWRTPQTLLIMLNHAPHLTQLELDMIHLNASTRTQPFHFPIQLAYPRLTHLVAGFEPSADVAGSPNGVDLILALIKVVESTLTCVSLGPHFPVPNDTISSTILQLPRLDSFIYHRTITFESSDPEADRLAPVSLIPHLLSSRLSLLDIRGHWPPSPLFGDLLDALPATLEVFVTSFWAPSLSLREFVEQILERKARLPRLRRVRIVFAGRVTVDMEAAVSGLIEARGVVEVVQEL